MRAILAVLLLAAAIPVQAQDPAGSPTVLVVDFQAVVRESAASTTIQQQIDEQRQAYQAEFGAVEREFRTIEATLTQERSELPEAEFLARRREFEQRIVAAQREAQTRRAALDQAADQAMSVVRSTLLDIVATIARERHADLVLNKAQVVFVDDALDVTDEALERLDRQLASVPVEIDPP